LFAHTFTGHTPAAISWVASNRLGFSLVKNTESVTFLMACIALALSAPASAAMGGGDPVVQLPNGDGPNGSGDQSPIEVAASIYSKV
jgi:hypothetical protein